jgi:hypothetical protein
MKIQVFLVAVAGLALVSASPPSDPIPWEDEESLRNYPACSRTVTDRCIQTNERSAASRDELASNDHLAEDTTGPARGGPHEAVGGKHAANDYPPCSRTVTDRCMQTNGRGSHAAATRMARSAPRQKHHSRRMQLAMRAGERG